MKLEDIFEMWQTDAVIDKTELGEESLQTVRLHSKYVELFIKERVQLHAMEAKYKKLYLDKYEFYSQGPSKETEEKGWKFPDKGLIIKNEISTYLDADPDIIELSLKIGIQKEKIQLLDSIVKQIQSRGFAIKNAIEFLKWTGGG